MKLTKIVRVLKQEDALCEGHLQNGARCVVGALLYHTGEFSKADLRGMDDALDIPTGYTGWKWEEDASSLESKARDALKRHYDMDGTDIKNFIELNDEIPAKEVVDLPETHYFSLEKDKRKRKRAEAKARLELVLAELDAWRLAGIR